MVFVPENADVVSYSSNVVLVDLLKVEGFSFFFIMMLSVKTSLCNCVILVLQMGDVLHIGVGLSNIGWKVNSVFKLRSPLAGCCKCLSSISMYLPDLIISCRLSLNEDSSPSYVKVVFTSSVFSFAQVGVISSVILCPLMTESQAYAYE